MGKLMDWIVRRPFTASALLLAMIIAAASALPRLQIDPTIDGLIIEDQDKAYYDDIKSVFGADTVLVIYLRSDAIFSEAGLQAIQDLTDGLYDLQLEQGEGKEPFYPMNSVRSLVTVNRIVGEDDGSGEIFLNTNPLVDYITDDPEELNYMRTLALESDLFVGDIISADGLVTTVNGFLAEAPEGFKAYDKHVVAKVEALLDQIRQQLQAANVEAELFQTGVPVAKVDLGDYIEADMQTLVPISLLVIFLILGFSFRTPIAMVLPLVTGMLSVIMALGLMAWLGFEINLISNIVPLLLLVIGCTEDIHILSDYAHETQTGLAKREAVRQMAIKSGLAVALTTLTTVLGFASLATNNIIMLREFGIAASLGLLFNFAITIVVIPTLLQLFPVPKSFRTKAAKRHASRLDGFADWLCNLLRTRRKLLLGFLTTVLIVFAYSASFVRVNTDMMALFLPDAPIRVNMDRLSHDVSGGQNFSIVIDTHREDGAKDPVILKAMLTLQQEMEAGAFDKAVSVANSLRAIHREANGDDPAYNVIPEQGIAEYLLLLEGEDLNRLLESTYQRTLIAVRHSITGSWRLNSEIEAVLERARELFPKYVSVEVTGKSILFNKAADAMARGQVESILMAMVFIFIIIAILFVSIKAGLLAMIPNLVPILATFAFMGMLGIPLSPGTCTVAVIALGIAVDDTIHLMVSFHGNLKTTTDQFVAMERTIHDQLVPVMTSSIALGLGFSVLTMAEITSSIDFGILASLVMFVALISDLFFTPALLLSTQLVSSWDLMRVRINEKVIGTSPLFKGFKPSELKRLVVLGVLEKVTSGEAILRQGEESREMYLLLRGTAQVLVAGKVTANLMPGDIFGEMAFVSGERRTADVVAGSNVEILKIDTSVLDRIRRRYPQVGGKLYRNISAILSSKLTKANQVLSGSAS